MVRNTAFAAFYSFAVVATAMKRSAGSVVKAATLCKTATVKLATAGS